jgi:hypothetical protein
MTNVGTRGHIDHGKRDTILIGIGGLSDLVLRALADAGQVSVKPLDYMDISSHDVVRRQSSNPVSGLNENGIPRKRKKGR